MTFKIGDILIIRTGWVKRYLNLDAANKQRLADFKDLSDHTYAGLEQSAEMVDFLHDCYFAAGVGDNPMLEVWPPKKFSSADYMLHAFMLPLWGMPIGELWDLEGLAEKCKKENQYSFLLTSAPDNVPSIYPYRRSYENFTNANTGSVGSRPNALAIF